MVLTSAPKPHPAFEDYVLVFSPAQGLLKIGAFGKDIETTVFGTELRSAYQEMKVALAAAYGTPRAVEYLPSGSIWKEPEDWMMGLLKKERTISALWEGALKNNLNDIVLEALASSQTKGYLELTYEFVGWGAYLDSKRAKSNTVL